MLSNNKKKAKHSSNTDIIIPVKNNNICLFFSKVSILKPLKKYENYHFRIAIMPKWIANIL